MRQHATVSSHRSCLVGLTLLALLASRAAGDEPEVPLRLETLRVGEAVKAGVMVLDELARWQAPNWTDPAKLEVVAASPTLPAAAKLTVTTGDLGKAVLAIPVPGGIDLALYQRLELEVDAPAAADRPILVTLAGMGALPGEAAAWFESAPRLVPAKPGLTVAFEPAIPEWKTEKSAWRYCTTPVGYPVQTQLFVLFHGLLSDDAVQVRCLQAIPHEAAAPARPADRELPARPEDAPEGPGLEAGRVAGIAHYVRVTLREYAADLRAAGLAEAARPYELAGDR